jgi:hypothetical protein
MRALKTVLFTGSPVILTSFPNTAKARPGTLEAGGHPEKKHRIPPHQVWAGLVEPEMTVRWELTEKNGFCLSFMVSHILTEPCPAILWNGNLNTGYCS